MLKKHLRVLLNPDAADGGGGTVAPAGEVVKGSAPVNLNGKMPEGLKGTEFSLDDADESALESEAQSKMNEGRQNKLDTT
jgi:hypothetical protein